MRAMPGKMQPHGHQRREASYDSQALPHYLHPLQVPNDRSRVLLRKIRRDSYPVSVRQQES